MCRRISWFVLSACFCVSAHRLGAEPQPGLSIEEALKAIRIPEGFTIGRIAGPPLIERPMLVSFDDRGRLFVADSAGVNLKGEELLKNPPHVIRLLEDTDGDGLFDKSTVYADKMVFPQGILWHNGSVYVSSPPSFWRLQDTNGDGVADKREELVTGFANTGVADDMHGASLGPDGRIYWFSGRFPHEIRKPGGPIIQKGTAPLMLRCKPDGTEVEVVCGTQGNAVGVAFTPQGEGFACGTFLAPDAMGAGLRDAIIQCVDGGEYPVRDRFLNEHKRTGELLPPLTHLGVSASADVMMYRDQAFGPEYEGDLFSCLFNMHKVMRHVLEREGATFRCRNEDFLVSHHPDFHPTDVLEDADGSLVVVDTGGWFRIGCPTSQIAKPEVKGGIYRVRRKGAKPISDPRGLLVKWDSLSSLELAALLDDPRFAVRDRAVEHLAAKGGDCISHLESIVQTNLSARARQNLSWAVTRIESDEAQRAASRGLDATDPNVRQVSARSAGLTRYAPSTARLMEIVRTDTPPVRREAATALGRIRQPIAIPALLAGLGGGVDRFLEHSIILALIQIGDREQTLKGLKDSDSAVRRGALIALDQMDGGKLTPDLVLPYLNPADVLLQQTALWIIAHHSDWGKEMLAFFRKWLGQENLQENQRDELKRQLLAFSKNSDIQEVIAQVLDDEKTRPETRTLLLETIAEAPLRKLPQSWALGLQRSLENPYQSVLRQAVATVRAVAPTKRPVLTRVDAAINFEQSEGKFAGTELSENFCVRWTGLVHISKDGKYTFYTESDDGSRLFIDGRQVVNNGGFHAMREKSGSAELKAGDHEIKIEYFEGRGGAGCKVSWALEGTKQILPAEKLFHYSQIEEHGQHTTRTPGLLGEYFNMGESFDDFPDLDLPNYDEPLVRLGHDPHLPDDLRVQALAAAAPRVERFDSSLFEFLESQLDGNNPPLVRACAAEALGHAPLDDFQLLVLVKAIAAAGALELPRLLPAYHRSSNPAIGNRLVEALSISPGLKSLNPEMLRKALTHFPTGLQEKSEPLFNRLAVDNEKQKSRLTELEPAVNGGDIQLGRDLFFGKKAACSTCHTVQETGGRIGPNLTKIAAIRTGRDLLEAIVFPSSSFARGYEPYHITTRDGEVHSGIIGRETAEALYLVNSVTSGERVLRSTIKDVQQSNVSIMPEGLDTQLTRQELADLIAFLSSLK